MPAESASPSPTLSRWRPDRLRTSPSVEDRGILGHPRGLPWMLNVEMWERFSYYGMRAILLYFITDTVARGGMGIDENTGQVILAAYGAAVYLLAIPGGIFADRIIGPWSSALYGGVVIMAGHLCLAGPTGLLSWIGIALVAVGTGFVKPNLSTIVGGLYDTGDPRRDAGFQLFYMSINIGSFFSPLVTGWLRAAYGYHAGFAAAAVGMALALVAFVYGRRKLSSFAFEIPNPLARDDRRRLLLGSAAAVVAAVVLVGLLYAVTGTMASAIAYALFLISTGASIAYFAVMLRSSKVTATERTHVRAYISLWIGAVLFWMIFEQASGKMATFALSHTDGTTPFFGWSFSAESYQSVNPATVVILAPVIGWLFTRRAGRFPSTVVKFATAVLIIGLSALMMGFGFSAWPGGAVLAPWWFLVVVFAFQTVGELFLSPVGLATTTALAPKAFASQAMALWFLAVSTGQGVAAVVIERTGGIGDSAYYYGLGAITVLMAVALYAVAPWTQRLMADVEG
ncbi:peptide MFS transporter [Actinomyces slackii]|uniref:Di-/tripeptide transporter n=1 Tax=Actinomyces slackii TaxID=52774 RepID=A0A448KBV1_9ACTO|nr:oligopeptide:H+ symporter [Actinomyces slackii]VEG74382.1 Di-/tripeptide transporter [Actinomyces slackii]